MTFTFLSAGWVALGLATLAGALFALQRLRVRHRDVTVITTQFWAEAVREARARVLVDRFRHPLAYLLVLLLASLLWIGAAGPRWDSDAAGDHVLLLDASARMGRPGRFEAAIDSVREDVAALPRDRTSVVLCGRTPRTLLLPGESALLLDERLAGLGAEVAPESVTSTLHEILLAHDGPLVVRLHGDAPLPPVDSLPSNVEVARAGPGPLPAAANAGVTALGVTDARSGAWLAVDVFVEVRGLPVPDSAQLPESWITVESTDPSESLPEPEFEQDTRRVTLRYRDVPANGATLSVKLAGDDALDLDDVATVTLPKRTPIRVALPPDAPPALRAVLEIDRAVQIVEPDSGADAGVDVWVVRASRRESRDDGSVPALILGNGSNGSFGIGGPDVVTSAGGNQSEIARTAIRELALDRIDATGLATEVGRAITVSAWQTEKPVVMVWEDLLSDRYDFVADDAFPVFVSRAMRRLAAVPAPIADAALTGALVSPEETAAAAAGLTDDAVPAGGAPGDLAAWAGLAAAGLLAAEWVLHRRGRIP